MGRIVNWGNDGLLYIVFKSEMAVADVDCFCAELKEAFRKYPPKIRVIADMSLYNNIPSESNMKKIVDAIKPLKVMTEKTGIFGMSAVVQTAAKLIFIMSGRTDVKIVKNLEEALQWVKS